MRKEKLITIVTFFLLLGVSFIPGFKIIKCTGLYVSTKYLLEFTRISAILEFTGSRIKINDLSYFFILGVYLILFSFENTEEIPILGIFLRKNKDKNKIKKTKKILFCSGVFLVIFAYIFIPFTFLMESKLNISPTEIIFPPLILSLIIFLFLLRKYSFTPQRASIIFQPFLFNFNFPDPKIRRKSKIMFWLISLFISKPLGYVLRNNVLP